MPVHLEGQHLAQVLLGGHREAQHAYQRLPLRNAHEDFIERLLGRLPQRGLDIGLRAQLRIHIEHTQLACAVGAAQADARLVAIDIDQQATRAAAHALAPRRWHQRLQLARPPGIETAQLLAQRISLEFCAQCRLARRHQPTRLTCSPLAQRHQRRPVPPRSNPIW
jgi:hypothetical protein